MKKLLCALALCQAFTIHAHGAELLDTFNPTGVASIVGIGIEPVSGNLYIYGEFGGATINVLDQTGTELSTITNPATNSNDFDLDFASNEMTIGGINVPAGSLLVFNGDETPETLYAVDPQTDTLLTSVGLASASLVGGTHIPGSNMVATIDFTSSDLIRILDASDGSELGFFSAGPPPFDIFYGDVDIAESTGEITVVSSSQNIVRQLTVEGFCVRDLDVSPFGISGMSGVAIDDSTDNLWISSTNGSIYHLDPRPDLGDSDNDGLLDFDDNCVNIANPAQVDTDGDGIGNACDADLGGSGTEDDDCVVNFLDLSALSNAFLSAPGAANWNPDADISGPAGTPDGVVNFFDISRLSELFLMPPGPSGRGNLCGCGL